MEVVAISRGPEKAELARQLGAHQHIDSHAEDPGQALAEVGGAQVVMATAASGAAASQLVPGLAPRGQLLVLGAADDPLEVPAPSLIMPGAAVVGHPSGTSQDSEDTLRFSRLTGTRPMIETMPLEKAPEAYEKMMSNQARFRMVLTM
jgi:alcohol dehydrogenase